MNILTKIKELKYKDENSIHELKNIIAHNILNEEETKIANKKLEDFKIIHDYFKYQYHKPKDENWLCPVCKSHVVIGEMRRLETLGEHAMDPKAEPCLKPEYKCSNKKCITHKYEIIWDYYGGLYVGKYKGYDEVKYISDNDAPFGSSQRKSNVEIFKKGLKDIKYLHPVLTLWICQLYIEYHYESNKNGEILKMWRTLGFNKKEKGKFSYPYRGSWPLNTWKFLWKQHVKLSKHNNKRNLKKLFEKSMNRSFNHRSFEFLIKILFIKSYLKYKNNDTKK